MNQFEKAYKEVLQNTRKSKRLAEESENMSVEIDVMDSGEALEYYKAKYDLIGKVTGTSPNNHAMITLSGSKENLKKALLDYHDDDEEGVATIHPDIFKEDTKKLNEEDDEEDDEDEVTLFDQYDILDEDKVLSKIIKECETKGNKRINQIAKKEKIDIGELSSEIMENKDTDDLSILDVLINS